MGIDQAAETFVGPVAEAIASVIFYTVPLWGQDIKLILVWLVAASLFLTLYLGFINFRFFGHAINLVRGKYDKPGGEDGQINRFQALTTSLSGTVGLGNIAGVAVAISVGGPGAAFWMAMMGLFGMTTKFAEVMLGVKYRHKVKYRDGSEHISGGPMYYLRDALNNRNIPYLGPVLGVVFALCCAVAAFGAGGMFQSNQAYAQLVNVTGGQEGFLGDKGWLIGLIMAALVGVVIIGGIRSIAAVASKIVPVMGGIYLLMGLALIFIHFQDVPAAFSTIFEAALTPQAGLGAFFGALLMGVQRATFSNEAGFGSAAIAHSAVKTDQPVSQGFVGMLGPFIDTVLICMVTAFVIVISGAYTDSEGMEGMALTSRAFADTMSWAPYILALTVFLFAYSTMITWSYYGVKAFGFIFGDNEIATNLYKVVFCACVVVGASAELSSVILFTDSMVFAMTLPNIIGLYIMAPEIKRDLKKYIQGIKNK